jgi:phosphohistidine swiveling domain-containing protein
MAGLPDALIGRSYPGMPATESADLTFTRADGEHFWWLDFHWPGGIVPLGTTYVRDCYAAAASRAADLLPLPDGRGVRARLVGPNLYGSPRRLTDPATVAARAAELAARLPALQAQFLERWRAAAAELDAAFARLVAPSSDPSPAAGLERLRAARAHQARAWEIHFEVMYPLVAGYVELRERSVAWGIDPQLVPLLLQGERTRIADCDRALHALATDARATGLAPLFARTAPDQLGAVLRRDGERWWTAFDEVRAEHGWRTEGIAAVHLPSWQENPTSALGTIKTLLADPHGHDFDAAEAALQAERAEATEEARATVGGGERGRQLDDLLDRNRRANFAWWNDEHNHWIDLRATIPLRLAALAIGEATGLRSPDDAVYLFWDELVAVAEGRRSASSVAGLVDERRACHRDGQLERSELPQVAGTIPSQITDPILLEVFGLHRHLLEASQTPANGATTLQGLGVSAGRARGPARVLRSALALHELVSGEVLVCEATSPNWTPAFAKAVACVCDVGGSLTHAAITARDYQIPCVVGAGRATAVIRSGDVVEVDGTTGVVLVEPATGR